MSDTETKIDQQLEALRAKQKEVDQAWQKTGNRGLLQFFVEIIPRLVEAERCSIFILDPVQDSVWVHCGTGVAERQIEVPKKTSAVGEVIATGQWLTRTGLNEKLGVHDQVAKATDFRTYDMLCVPIRNAAGDQVTGAIQVLNKKWGLGYTDEDRLLLEKFAFHLQQNIENIFLRQEWGKFSLVLNKKIKELEGMKIRLKLQRQSGD